MSNQSVTRTLVSDYTTKAEWLIPDLSKVLGDFKYAELNRQINIGLNSLFFNDNEKFANASIKAKIFIQRLEAPRNKFLEFLNNEINRVCDIMGFRDYPEAYFEDIALRDEADFIRLYTRMAELGILTPEQLFNTVNTGALPNTENYDDEYIKAHQDYQKQREDGLFLPLVGASQQDQNGMPLPTAGGGGGPPGRPSGTTGIKQAGQRKSSPVKKTSLSALQDTIIKAHNLLESVIESTKAKHSLAELDKNQSAVCQRITEAIMLNEPENKWKKSVAKYLQNLKPVNKETLDKVIAIATEDDIDTFDSAILYIARNKTT